MNQPTRIRTAIGRTANQYCFEDEVAGTSRTSIIGLTSRRVWNDTSHEVELIARRKNYTRNTCFSWLPPESSRAPLPEWPAPARCASPPGSLDRVEKIPTMQGPGHCSK